MSIKGKFVRNLRFLTLDKNFLKGLVVGYGLMSLTLSYVSWLLGLYLAALISITTFLLLLYFVWRVSKEIKDEG